MRTLEGDNQRAPLFIPFVVAISFGIPVVIVWYLVAMKVGILATAITIVLGCACGYGARISASGWHPAEAAIYSTLILIVVGMSAVTIGVVASETNQTFLASLFAIVRGGDLNQFANACVVVAGKTFYGYPIGLYAAYRISDAS